MRRSVRYLLLWVTATLLAGFASWLGVRGVLVTGMLGGSMAAAAVPVVTGSPSGGPGTAGSGSAAAVTPSVSSGASASSGVSGASAARSPGRQPSGSASAGAASGATAATSPAPASRQGSAGAAPGVASPAEAAGTPAPGSTAHAYQTAGGSAVFDLGPGSATLVSATPAGGYGTSVSQGTGWLRVDFTTGDGQHGYGIVASWYEHAPTVQIVRY